VTGKFVRLDCLGAKANAVLDVNGKMMVFAMDRPTEIDVFGLDAGHLDMKCGPQTSARVRLEFDRSDTPGIDGLVRVLDFRQE
jgi:hypothetical protein